MDAGMAPVHGLVSFCVCLVQHTRTLQLVLVERKHPQVREVADRLRQGACAVMNAQTVDQGEQKIRVVRERWLVTSLARLQSSHALQN